MILCSIINITSKHHPRWGFLNLIIKMRQKSCSQPPARHVNDSHRASDYNAWKYIPLFKGWSSSSSSLASYWNSSYFLSLSMLIALQIAGLSREGCVCILSKQHACILYAVQLGAPKRPELFLGSKTVCKSLRSKLFVRISIIPATKNILPRIKPFLLAAGKCTNPASIKILLQDRRCIYKRPESLNISF